MRNYKQPKPEPEPEPNNITPTQNISPTMPSLPEYHGAVAPKQPCVRRRWRRKDRTPATAVAGESAAAAAVNNLPDQAVYAVNERRSARDQDLRSDDGAESVLERFAATMRPIDASRMQVQEKDRGYQRVDSVFGSECSVTTSPSSSSSSPSNASKPTLSATSTSAEIVEALMPDRPGRSTRLRHTASVHESYEEHRWNLQDAIYSALA